MIRGLLPAKLVNPDDSVSDLFVSFLAFSKLFSSIAEGNKVFTMPSYLGAVPLFFEHKNTILSTIPADKNTRLMYVCGMVAAGLSVEGSSSSGSQPRFLKTMITAKENITITYVLSPKSLKQKP